jgi:peptidoglycan/LPS O-acetylase OafA/YrhL
VAIAITRKVKPSVLYPGHVGVSIFFGISGFIITTLLIKEEKKSGTIDLRAFYLRRALRILPPLAAFLLGSAVFAPKLGLTEYVRAALFLGDYWATPHWWLAHTWSLAVEEQFYLLWPLALWAMGSTRALRLSVALLATAPAVRVFFHFALPHLRPWEWLTFHANMDAIVVGCAVAIIRERSPGARTLRVLERGPVALASLVFLLVASPYLQDWFEHRYQLTVGVSAQAVAIGSIICWAVRPGKDLVRRVLNARPAVHLGFISYGLYLWQQPFFDPTLARTWLGWMPVAVVAALVMAELSYYLLEQPILLRRAWILERLIGPTGPAVTQVED